MTPILPTSEGHPEVESQCPICGRWHALPRDAVSDAHCPHCNARYGISTADWTELLDAMGRENRLGMI